MCDVFDLMDSVEPQTKELQLDQLLYVFNLIDSIAVEVQIPKVGQFFKVLNHFYLVLGE